jgi:hypothetical protein
MNWKIYLKNIRISCLIRESWLPIWMLLLQKMWPVTAGQEISQKERLCISFLLEIPEYANTF